MIRFINEMYWPEIKRKKVVKDGVKKRHFWSDEQLMHLALKEAEKGARRGEVPVGAVVVAEGKVLARAHNLPVSRNDPTAHAEILALRLACRRRKNYRLPDCDLFVTLEPCPMCLGAAWQARIKRIVFAAYDPKAGAVNSVMRFPWEKLNHQLHIQGGLLAKESAEILRRFFQKRREEKREKGKRGKKRVDKR